MFILAWHSLLSFWITYSLCFREDIYPVTARTCGQWHGSRFPDFRRSPSGERRCPRVEETFQTGSQPTIQKHNPAEQTSPRSTFAVVGSTLSAPPARAPDIKVGSRAGAPHCLVSRNVNNYHEREWQVYIKKKKGQKYKNTKYSKSTTPRILAVIFFDRSLLAV